MEIKNVTIAAIALCLSASTAFAAPKITNIAVDTLVIYNDNAEKDPSSADGSKIPLVLEKGWIQLKARVSGLSVAKDKKVYIVNGEIVNWSEYNWASNRCELSLPEGSNNVVSIRTGGRLALNPAIPFHRNNTLGNDEYVFEIPYENKTILLICETDNSGVLDLDAWYSGEYMSFQDLHNILGNLVEWEKIFIPR